MQKQYNSKFLANQLDYTIVQKTTISRRLSDFSVTSTESTSSATFLNVKKRSSIERTSGILDEARENSAKLSLTDSLVTDVTDQNSMSLDTFDITEHLVVVDPRLLRMGLLPREIFYLKLDMSPVADVLSTILTQDCLTHLRTDWALIELNIMTSTALFSNHDPSIEFHQLCYDLEYSGKLPLIFDIQGITPIYSAGYPTIQLHTYMGDHLYTTLNTIMDLFIHQAKVQSMSRKLVLPSIPCLFIKQDCSDSIVRESLAQLNGIRTIRGYFCSNYSIELNSVLNDDSDTYTLNSLGLPTFEMTREDSY
jgi:hypothetical protein